MHAPLSMKVFEGFRKFLSGFQRCAETDGEAYRKHRPTRYSGFPVGVKIIHP